MPLNPHDAGASEEAPEHVADLGTPSSAGRIEIRDHEPAWQRWYATEADRIRRALGDRVVRLEHAGSTSVPGLPAKPIIDVVLEVADSADEPAYVPALEAAGYVLRFREPDWFEHRFFTGPDVKVNLHTFSAGCAETERMLLFRDRLRADPADRDRYAAVKRELAKRDWPNVQQYADAKSDIIAEILARATTPRT